MTSPNPISLARVALAIALGAALGAQPLAARDENTPEHDPLDPLKACQAIVDNTARLTCFDKAAGEIVTAANEGELKVVDREQVRQTRRKLFGFSLPDFGIFGKGDDDEKEKDKIEILNTTIAAVSGSTYGYLIHTQEGAVWQVDEMPRRLMSPKVGQSLEIKRGALGSFFLRINGQPGVKGHRVR